MLKSRAGNDQSVQTTTCAICGRSLVFTIVNSVVRAVVCGDLKSTSKYGNSSVAAGAEEAMSHVSSLFVEVGSSPLLNVAFGATLKWPLANAELATSSTAITTISFLISFSYTQSWGEPLISSSGKGIDGCRALGSCRHHTRRGALCNKRCCTAQTAVSASAAMKMLSQQVETENRPRAVPGEEVPRKRSDHARTAQRERVVGREGVRLVGEEDDVGPQREDLLGGHRRVALALAQHVAAADALDQRRDVRVAAAPH